MDTNSGNLSSRETSPSVVIDSTETLSEKEQVVVSVMLVELEVLRNQIYTLMNFEVQIVNFSLAFIGIVGAALTQVWDKLYANPEILLFCACVFMLFGFMHSYEKFRIFETAAYIETHIAAPIKAITGHSPLTKWEKFRSFRSKRLFVMRCLSILRSSLFVTPTLALLVIFIIFRSNKFYIYDIFFIIFLVLVVGIYIWIMRTLNVKLAFRLAAEFKP